MTPKPVRHRASGFTLIELIVSMTLLGVIFTALFGVVISMQRNYFRQRDASAAEEAVRTAELVVASVLRSAATNPRGTAPVLIDPDPLNHGVFDNIRIASDFTSTSVAGRPDGDVQDPLEDVAIWTANDTLYVRWVQGGQSVPLLHPVRPLRFEYYAHNGTLLTTKLEAAPGAVRVRVLFRAPSNLRSQTLQQRELWVYLRNRR